MKLTQTVLIITISTITLIMLIIFIIYIARIYKNANNNQLIYIDIPKNLNSYSKEIAFDKVPTSKNKIQCSYSIWLYFENAPENVYRQYGNNKFYPILEKKTHNTKMGSPGLYYRPKDSNIMVSIKTTTNNTFIVKSIILQRWNNIVIVVEDRNLDVYINGKLYRSFYLNNVIDLGESDLHINNNNNLYGTISYFRYFNYALNPDIVERLYNNTSKNKPIKPSLWWLYP